MTKDKLYRLIDLMEEVKKLDEIMSAHLENKSTSSDLMLAQYASKKEKLLEYMINEINSTNSDLPERLTLIKRIMERFYSIPASISDSKRNKDFEILESALAS